MHGPKTGRISASIALCTMAISTAASAAGFTPNGEQHWVAVAQSLVDASNAGNTEQMGNICQGVTIMGGGSEIRKESTEVPRWAVDAHFQTCIAFNSVSSRERGRGKFMSSTNPCKQLKQAVDDLSKTQMGVDPDDVVAVAGKLKAALTSLASDYKDAKSCKLAKVGLF